MKLVDIWRENRDLPADELCATLAGLKPAERALLSHRLYLEGLWLAMRDDQHPLIDWCRYVQRLLRLLD